MAEGADYGLRFEPQAGSNGSIALEEPEMGFEVLRWGGSSGLRFILNVCSKRDSSILAGGEMKETLVIASFVFLRSQLTD